MIYSPQDSQETRKFQRQLLQGVQNVGDGLNSMNRLFAEYALRKERKSHPGYSIMIV